MKHAQNSENDQAYNHTINTDWAKKVFQESLFSTSLASSTFVVVFWVSVIHK